VGGGGIKEFWESPWSYKFNIYRSSIPKNNNLEVYEYYNPVSLCNTIYKIIGKIIANRLIRVFSNSISQEKFGFLYNRIIHDVVGSSS
jgi:hypothetical protein